MRTSRSSRRSVRSRATDPAPRVDSARLDAEQGVVRELETWRARAIPDLSAPLDSDDIVSLLRNFVNALALEPAVAASFTANTVHYYRRKDIIDPPVGRTTAARYSVRHFWQVAGSRLAGHLGLVTLAEARDAMRGAGEPALVAFVAARVADARARDMLRSPDTEPPTPDVRPLPGRPARTRSAKRWTVTITLPGDVLCIVPESHEALRSTDAARELARSLAVALDAESSTD